MVHLECRYPKVIALSSTVDIAQQATFRIVISLPTTYTDEALLDTTSQLFNDTATAITNVILEYWVGEPNPISIRVIGFTLSGRRRRRTVSELLTGQIELTFASGIPENLEDLLQNTLQVMQDSGKVVHASVDIDNLAIEATTVNGNQNWHNATIQGDGNLAAGFDLNIFADETYATELTKMIMGNSLFAKVEWSLPVSDMTFYVQTCRYSCGTDPLASVEIIKVSQYRLIIYLFNYFIFRIHAMPTYYKPVLRIWMTSKW